VVFHPAGEEHAVEFHEEPVRIFRVDLDELWLNLVRDYSTVLDSPAVFEGGQPAGLALRLYREFQSADSAAPLAIKGLALEVLAEASRRGTTSATRTPPLWLRRAQDMIRERFAETLTLGAIADAVAVHPVHLARAFRRVHGCSIGEYVRRLRVDFACRALSNSALPLAAIAISAGFADQSHFTGVFRRQTGLTPLSFRKTCGGC
jgi:AraC family transcriptional regulator